LTARIEDVRDRAGYVFDFDSDFDSDFDIRTDACEHRDDDAG